jgi:hypothetical protein
MEWSGLQKNIGHGINWKIKMIKLLKEEKPEGIWAGDMKDGDIGVIVASPAKNCIGRIVQRCNDSLIFLGYKEYHHWYDTFGQDIFADGFRVRLLEKGEKLIVT